MKQSSPPRVHIIMARKADTAIVIRRGPSKSVCTLLWNRRKDTFTMGQWLRGRIYERRCDLSPDGRHFIYFAMNGLWDGELKGSWTALSKAPYLKALGLWAKGDCWHGGGLFANDQRYWLNAGYGMETRIVPGHLREDPSFPFHTQYGGECQGVYFIRLQRDGWTLTDHASEKGDGRSFFEKQLTKGWVLRKTAVASNRSPVGKGCYYDKHSLHNTRTGLTIDATDWEWADLDRKRVVWIRDGVLHAAKIGDQGLFAEKTLHDFNGMKFEAIPAPY